MMAFRTIKAALEDLLSNAAAGRFEVIGHQRQITNIEQFLSRKVQVFYTSGMFPKDKAAGMQGPVAHDMTFRLELFVASGSEGNLAALEAATTPEERIAAISSFKESARLADDALDALADDLFQIIMDARNQNLGMDEPPTGTVLISNRWISELNKETPVGDGEYSGLTGTMTLNLTAVEEITGDLGLPAGTPEEPYAFDIELSVNTNPVLESTDETVPIAGTKAANQEE